MFIFLEPLKKKMELSQQEFKTENEELKNQSYYILEFREELKNQNEELKKEKENLLNDFRVYLLRGILLVSRDMKMKLSTFEGEDIDSDEESKEENV